MSEEQNRNGNGKRKPEPVEDKSTPKPDDPAFFAWMLGHFQEDERAECITATQVFGRHHKTVGNIVLRREVRSKEITPEYIVALSNEFLDAMQNETNAMRRTCSFTVTAHNFKKGAEPFATRTVTMEPTKVHFRNGEGEGEDDEEGISPNGGDLLRKRAETLFQDGRFWGEHVTTTLGGMMQMMSEQLREKDKMIKDLFDANMALARAANEAQNNALDRELVREDKKFAIEAKRKGMNLLAGLLPDIARKVAGVNVPGGRTSESMAVESVMDALSTSERLTVFGDWTDDGVRTKPGILTEAQVRILVGVLKEEVKADVLDQLIFGPAQITYDQFGKISSAIDVDKLLPLVSILKDRKEKLEAQAAQAQAEARASSQTAAQNATKEG